MSASASHWNKDKAKRMFGYHGGLRHNRTTREFFAYGREGGEVQLMGSKNSSATASRSAASPAPEVEGPQAPVAAKYGEAQLYHSRNESPPPPYQQQDEVHAHYSHEPADYPEERDHAPRSNAPRNNPRRNNGRRSNPSRNPTVELPSYADTVMPAGSLSNTGGGAAFARAWNPRPECTPPGLAYDRLRQARSMALSSVQLAPEKPRQEEPRAPSVESAQGFIPRFDVDDDESEDTTPRRPAQQPQANHRQSRRDGPRRDASNHGQANRNRRDRPNRPARADHPARPNRQDRPERPARPGRADRHDRAAPHDRNDRSDRHERPARPNRPDHHDRSDRPNRPARHGRSDRADRQGRPNRQDRAHPPLATAMQNLRFDADRCNNPMNPRRGSQGRNPPKPNRRRLGRYRAIAAPPRNNSRAPVDDPPQRRSWDTSSTSSSEIPSDTSFHSSVGIPDT